jgi:hypothetical protein
VAAIMRPAQLRQKLNELYFYGMHPILRNLPAIFVDELPDL